MRITSLQANNIPPIRSFSADNLGGAVIIAGANGSGKSRLKDHIVACFQNPQQPNISLTVSATRPRETQSWGTESVTLTHGQNNTRFQQYMRGSSRGRAYAGSVIQIESNRSAAAVKFKPLTLATQDPDDVNTANNFFMQPLTSRWSHTVNSIFQKVANRDQKIAQHVKANLQLTGEQALAAHPDPYLKYQTAFAELLPGKTLEPIDPKQLKEFHYRNGSSEPLAFATLSSGEKEVVRIVFGLLLKDISHSVILVDEPELHLHPTLAFRLMETLRKMGGGTNQFVFFTHSADLISTYYSSGNVFFIDKNETVGNQARRLSDLGTEHSETAQAIGANLGMFAVGKRLVFVEGEDASVDRMTYHRIAETILTECSVVPIGSVENVRALSRLSVELDKTVFGLDFFMIRDRDGLTEHQITVFERNPRARCLKRRHVENYYLDSVVLAEVAQQLYLPAQWHDPSAITTALKDIATANVTLAAMSAIKEYVTVNGTLDSPTTRGIQNKSPAELKAEVSSFLADGLAELSQQFSSDSTQTLFDGFLNEFNQSIANDTWILCLPGKILFNMFCGQCFSTDSARIRHAYLDAALSRHPNVFADISEHFRHFATLTAP